MRINHMAGRSLTLLASLVFLMGCGRDDALAQERQNDRELQQEQLGAEVPAAVDTSTAAALSQTFRSAAATALPGVVTVQVTAQPQQAQRRSPFPFFDIPQMPDGQAPPQTGTGSGFVLDEDGYIVTNNHVVEDATEIQVRFPDGRIYDNVELIGRDPNTDIAVIRIQPRDGDEFRALEIGDSDRLQVGDWVLALGNPLGLGFTVTAGIVSAKGRSLQIIQGDFPLESFIQTDAAINRGNSGGPLVDLYGRVIGVNTAIYSQTGLYSGNGFAVPAAIAVKAARDMIEYGYVRRPMIGVTIGEVGEAQAELYGLDRIAGVVISSVNEGGPADGAGIRPEDVVISLDGTPVENRQDLTTRLARREPGEDVTLGIVRDGRRIDVEVELGQFEIERPETRTASTSRSAQDMLGLSFTELTPSLVRQLDVREGVEGVVVTEVSPYGPAAGQVARGDIILEFNRQPVQTVRALEGLAADVEEGDVVVLRVWRSALQGPAVVSFRIR
jgi:serine protease Do